MKKFIVFLLDDRQVEVNADAVSFGDVNLTFFNRDEADHRETAASFAWRNIAGFVRSGNGA